MIDPIKIIEQYYTPDSDLCNLLLNHSRAVAEKALAIADTLAVEVDREFLYQAAMLHDIGVCKTYAPSIYCGGTHKYIMHGVLGAEMLREYGLSERYALVCERHTGAGMTAQEIAAAGLPLPIRDMLPISIEERLICYADKFYSKSKPDVELTVEMIEHGLARYGANVLMRFKQLRTEFE